MKWSIGGSTKGKKVETKIPFNSEKRSKLTLPVTKQPRKKHNFLGFSSTAACGILLLIVTNEGELLSNVINVIYIYVFELIQKIEKVERVFGMTQKS